MSEENNSIESSDIETAGTQENSENSVQAWWRESAFVIQGNPRIIIPDAKIPKVPNIYDTLKDILPALREEGELKLQGRRFSGMTEWIPGVDPVGELIEDTWLPPLPPSVTTRMRTFEDVEGDEPGGGGHLNIMIDLSGSMSAKIGMNSSYQDVKIKETAQTLASMLVSGCESGGHTFVIGAYGNSDGNNGVLPIVNAASRFWKRDVARATRIIWGRDASQRKDYKGATASLNNAVETKMSGGVWQSMTGTNSGAGMARMYYLMTEQLKGTEIRTAPLIFLSDCVQRDLDVPRGYYEMQGEFPVMSFDKVMKDGFDESSQSGDVGSLGFWYWARKYSRDCGPVILIQMTPQSWVKDGYGPSPEYINRIRQAFIQIVGQGEPSSDFEKCFMPTVDAAYDLEGIYMDGKGGNLRLIAQRLNEFIKDMNGEGEICCGGKGISFDNN